MSRINNHKGNNQEIGDKNGNITVDNSTTSTTTNNSMTHDHEAFINQIRLFSGLPIRN
jgi:hypothetical protein